MKTIVETEERDGVVVTSYRFLEKRHFARTIEGAPSADGSPNHVVFADQSDIYQVGFEMKGGSVLLEPGAFQYSHGDIKAEVIRHEPGKGLLGRMVSSAGTGESAYATKFTGHGHVWAEPTRRHFIVGTMDGEGDALLLDDKAFYACTSGISLSTHTHRSVSGLFSGNGLLQPKLTGRGVFVVESPVPVAEIDEITLSNQEAVIDGDYMLMYSAGLSVRIDTLVKGWNAARRSGEGFVYRLQGTGTIWVMPTMKIS